MTDAKGWRDLMGKLCVIYSREWDEPTSRFYWDALKDLELAELEQAAVRLAQTLKWFPKPAELRTAVFQLRHDQRVARDAELLTLPAELADYCEHCRDTGWQMRELGVSPCSCRETNPVYQRRRAHERVAAGAEGEHATEEQIQKQLQAVKDFKQLSSGD